MLKTAYTNIRDRLLETMSPMVVDLEKGQFSQIQDNYPLPLPCILVDFEEIYWSDTTGEQIGEGEVSVYHYVDAVNDTINGAELSNETISLLSEFDNMYKALHGFESDVCKLKRKRTKVNKFNSGLLCLQTTFDIVIYQEPVGEPVQKISKPKVEFNF